MLYYVPDIRLPSELPALEALQDKFGGLPWGFPARMWPLCGDCGQPQSFLAQFTHHAERLDLGREGRVINVFQCNHDPGMCSTWEGAPGQMRAALSSPRT